MKKAAVGPGRRCRRGGVPVLTFLAVLTALTAPAAEERFLPALPEAAPSIAVPASLPTGAVEFAVEPPRPHGGAVVNAADFGVSPENPDNVEALSRAIEHCRATGAAELRLAPGTYWMRSGGVCFEKLRDFTFDGGGARLIYTEHRTPNIRILDCERTVFRNFSMDWDWEHDPLASVVEVAGTTSDTVDFRFRDYARFPRRDVRLAITTSFDPRTGSVGVEDGFDRSYEFFAGQNRPETRWLSDNVIRVKLTRPHRYQPGQLHRLQHTYYEKNGISMRDNRHLSLRDIDILSCSGSALVIGGLRQQYWEFRRVRIVPPPGDPKRVITCTGDHCHIINSNGFFKMEDCEFSFGADDCLNAHDRTCLARKSGPDRIVSERMNQTAVEPGAMVELRQDDYTPTGFRARVRETRQTADGLELVFDRPVPDPSGEGLVVFNRELGTRNLIVRNCFFHDNRARGLLLLADDVTIENNRFRHNDMGAIKIETGYCRQWCEGFGANNIVVRGNDFDTVNPRGAANEGKARDIFIGVYRKVDPSPQDRSYPVLTNLLFENNRFRDSFGLIAFIGSARNVIFRNNRFENATPRRRKAPYRAGFFVTNSSDVYLLDNRYAASDLVPSPGVYWRPESVRNLYFEGNRVVPRVVADAVSTGQGK